MHGTTKTIRDLKKGVHHKRSSMLGRLLVVACMVFGIALFAGFTKYSEIYATAQSVITKTSDADFTQGLLSNLQVNGSGSGAYLNLTGGNNWWSPNYSYRRQLVIDITGNASLVSGYTVHTYISGSDAATIYSNSLTTGNDFRVVYFDGSTSTELTRDLISFSGSTIEFYHKTQALLSGNDASHYYIYYGYAGAVSPTIDKTQVYNNTYNGALSSNGATASASDVYSSNPISQINNGIVGGGAGSVGWGNNNQAGSRAMIKLSSSTKIWKIEQRWDGDNTGGWSKPAGTYFPNNYKVQYSTNPSAIASDVSGSANWNTLTESANALSVSRTNAPGSPTYSGSPTISTDTITTNMVNCSNCWGTILTNVFNPTDALAVRYVYGNTTWIGTMEEFYVYPINQTPASTEPTTSLGAQTTNLAPSGTWESPTNSNVTDLIWNGGWGDGTAGSTAFSASIANVGANNTIGFAIRTSTSAPGLASASYIDIGTANAGTTFTKTKAQLDALGLGIGTNRYIQIKATFAQTSGTNPQLDSITLYYLSDNSGPESNASNISMQKASGGITIAPSGWTSGTQPYFSFTQGTDSESNIKGYCIYLGTDPLLDPGTTKGTLLGTSPVSTTGSTCQFIIPGTTLDLSTAGYISTALTSSLSPYYLLVKAIDNGNNIYQGAATSFAFLYDGTAPTNVAYLSTPSTIYSNVNEMVFSWPTNAPSFATDTHSQVLGYQYQINSSSGTWKGTTHSTACDLDYIPVAEGSHTLTALSDGSDIVIGNNVVYLRTIDNVCNPSTSATYRTGNLEYGGEAPSFAISCSSTTGVVVTPLTNTDNSYSFAWDEATPSNTNTITHYYYMINTQPPGALSTIISNNSTYIDVGTNTSVSTRSFSGLVKGTNTVYVVARDSVDNYSSSTCIKGTFVLDSDYPDPPKNVTVSDASIKASSLWRASLAWSAPDYTGTGTLTYTVSRSEDSSTWTEITTTTGTAYVDTVPTSTRYYFKVCSHDTSSESITTPSCANTITIIPKGSFTSAPDLASGPTVSSITTKKATIKWTTSRNSDSKVSYGTGSNSYYSEEPSNSTQVTDHTINLTNLSPGTTYFYKTKWTDEDGNTGISEEKSFKTEDAPTVKDVSATKIGLDSAIIKFTSLNASKVKIYYGTTTSFGGTIEISTSTSETAYTTEIAGLNDNTKYYYKINAFDTESSEYEGTVLDFTTLPRPKITNVRFQEVTGTAQPAIIVSWDTNTETSSIITYYPQGRPQLSRDEVSVSLVKGPHKMLLKNLNPQTIYEGQVKGKDKAGNEAVSDTQSFTTSTDTRPPQVMNLRIEGSSDIQGSSSSGSVEDAKSQLVVSWDTDEPATSQVEFGEGTGTTYTQKTQEDTNLTTNHVIIISNLTPSKVYHLRTLSKDKAQNTGQSVDTVTITPKSSRSALELVIGNLSDIFGILGR
jgi:hypothetical protein